MRRLAIGIDLGGTNIKGALVDEAGRFVAELTEHTPAEKGREAVISAIYLVIERLMAHSRDVTGIGIGTPGIVSQSGEIIGASPNIVNWVGTSLKSRVTERYDVPVEVENDAQAITMGEFYFGGNNSDMVCIALGTGIGIGIILDGRLFRQAHETGHMIVNYDGLVCGCMRKGCMEAYASATGLVHHYQTLSGRKEEVVTPKGIFDKFQQGEKAAKMVVDDFVRALGAGMANFVLTLSVTNFVIAGGVSHSFPLFRKRLLEEARSHSISHLNDKITIREGTLGKHAGILGAVSLVFNSV